MYKSNKIVEKQKKEVYRIPLFTQKARLKPGFCGKSGIQTHGTARPYAGFRVRSIRSLWHLSLIRVQKYTKNMHSKRTRIKLL